jgi:hypothetical protein
MYNFSSYYIGYGWLNSVYYLHADGDDCRVLMLLYLVLEHEIPASTAHVIAGRLWITTCMLINSIRRELLLVYLVWEWILQWV